MSRISTPKSARVARVRGTSVVNEERLYQLILKPVVSEKSTTVADKNQQIVFQVRNDANKYEVQQAVEKMFKVKVKRVQIVNMHGKTKRFGGRLGKRSDWKKAYVGLQPGHDIDFQGMTGG